MVTAYLISFTICINTGHPDDVFPPITFSCRGFKGCRYEIEFGQNADEV